MNRSFAYLLLALLISLISCRKQAVDINPDMRVRPVSLQVNVSDTQYELSWQPVYIVCITAPCPDAGNVEAEEYEVQVASSELGEFYAYQRLDPAQKSIRIPVSQVGKQVVIRIVSKHSGAPSVNSNLIMTSAVPIAHTTDFDGYGTSADVFGGDILPNGTKSTYLTVVQEASGTYATPLYLVDLQNDRAVNPKQITQLGGIATFSPDGKQLAYISRTTNGLIIYDIATQRTQTLPVADATWIWSLDWSPDGKWLAFSTVSNDESRLWKIPASGGQAIALTPVLLNGKSNYIRQSNIDWSPDGQSVSLSLARTDALNTNWRAVISLYSSDGTGEVSFFETQPGWVDTNPSFSPDGKKLAFLSSRTDRIVNTYSLWLRDPATRQLQQIRLPADQQLSNDYTPHWIGSNKLVYMAYAQGRNRYFTVSLN